MNADYDVIIIGLGPAGAALARLLAPHMRVLALDRKTDISGLKPCGGLLVKLAMRILPDETEEEVAETSEAPEESEAKE